jgi:anti-sigma regulatory factor (Ser/Thr protein kinase)
LERSFRFPVTSDAPRLARLSMDGWLNEHVGPDRADDARLLASELVANAVLHGDVPEGEVITLSVERSDSTVRIVVEQPTSASPARVVEPSATREGGFGLQLVAHLADSWGVEQGVPGKVWFVISGPDWPG